MSGVGGRGAGAIAGEGKEEETAAAAAAEAVVQAVVKERAEARSEALEQVQAARAHADAEAEAERLEELLRRQMEAKRAAQGRQERLRSDESTRDAKHRTQIEAAAQQVKELAAKVQRKREVVSKLAAGEAEAATLVRRYEERVASLQQVCSAMKIGLRTGRDHSRMDPNPKHERKYIQPPQTNAETLER